MGKRDWRESQNRLSVRTLFGSGAARAEWLNSAHLKVRTEPLWFHVWLIEYEPNRSTPSRRDAHPHGSSSTPAALLLWSERRRCDVELELTVHTDAEPRQHREPGGRIHRRHAAALAPRPRTGPRRASPAPTTASSGAPPRQHAGGAHGAEEGRRAGAVLGRSRAGGATRATSRGGAARGRWAGARCAKKLRNKRLEGDGRKRERVGSAVFLLESVASGCSRNILLCETAPVHSIFQTH
jgi:hypothetical protein